MYNSYLEHHGIKGMKWGVRRYQNKDGTLTTEGKERLIYSNRARRAARTKADMDKLYNTLSKEDKKLLGDDENNKEWLTLEEGEFVVKRFLKKEGDIPIAALDIMTTTKDGHLTVALMTNPKYRGSGEASRLAKKGYDWFSKNADKYNASSLGWGAYAKNKASRRIAEKTGFKYNSKASDNEWSVYDYVKHYGTEGMHWGIQNGPPYPIDPIKKAHLKTGEMDPDEYTYAKELKRKYKDGLKLPGKEKEYVYELFDNQLTKEQKKRALVFCNSQYYTYGAINLGHNEYTIISKKGIDGRKNVDPIVNEVLTEMFGVNWEDYDESI